MRRAFNFWPCIFCSGGKVTFIAGDFKELHVSLKLGIRTRNRVGTVYGGSIYSSVNLTTCCYLWKFWAKIM